MKIDELMIGIKKLDLVLPEFQREYVWNREQAKQLIVSLFREYPTGSLLFWKTDSPPEIKNSELDPKTIGTTTVILDGQQRLTTLYLFTQNEIPPYYREEDIQNDPRELYVDLESGDLHYFQTSKMSGNPSWVPVTACFTEKIRPFEIAREKTDDDEKVGQLAERYFDTLTRLRSIKERAYPVQVVPASAGIHEAIDVFDRVNSMGTKLSEAELALAHVTGKWPQARRVLKAKIEELDEEGFSFDLTFMVRALTGVTLNRALYEHIHRTEASAVQEGWKKLSKILDYLVNVLPGQAKIHSTADLNTNNVLVPVLVYLANHDMKFPDDRSLKTCVHWLYAASAWARYTAQTSQRLEHDLTIIQRTENPWGELVDAIIDQRGRIEVKPIDLEGRTTSHPLYRMTYVMAKSQGAIDWFNGSSLEQGYGPSFKIHSHHIFPTSLLYSEEGGYDGENHLHKKLVNEIANRAFLTADSNITLGNKSPAEYLPEIEEKYPGALAKQFVPTDPALWEVDRYEDFLRARRQLIADAINKRMEELLQETPAVSEPPSTSELARSGENSLLEYKGSVRWDYRSEQVNKALTKSVAKTIAAFLNSEGGTLLIGVADDCSVWGIEKDLQTLSRSDHDGYEQHLVQVLDNYIGSEHLQYVDMKFDELDGKTLCRVDVDRSPKPIYLYEGDRTEFYIRAGNTSRALDVEQAHDYIAMHWDDY